MYPISATTVTAPVNSNKKEEVALKRAQDVGTVAGAALAPQPLSAFQKAMKEIQKDPKTVLFNARVSAYEQLSELERFQIALALSEREPGGVCVDIDCFEITNPSYLSQLAFALAKKAAKFFLSSLEHFKLDEPTRLEVVITFLNNDKSPFRAINFSIAFTDLNLTDPALLLKYALFWVQNAPDVSISSLKDLKLTQEGFVEVATYLIKNHPKLNARICGTFDDFRLTDSKHVLPLALALAETCVDEVCIHIEKFQLNEADKIKLAQKVVTKDPQRFAISLVDWHIKEQKALFQLTEQVVLQSPQLYWCFERHLQPGPAKEALETKVFEIACKTGAIFTITANFIGCLPTVEKKAASLLPALRAKIAKAPEMAKAQLENWLKTHQMRLLALYGEKVPPVLEALSEALMDYRAPAERLAISAHILGQADAFSFVEKWQKVLPQNKERKPHPHALIPTALVLRFTQDGAFTENWARELASHRDTFRFGPSFAQLISYLLMVNEHHPAQAKPLLGQVFCAPEKDVVARLRHLKVLLMLGKETNLRADKSLPLAALEKLSSSLLCETLGISPAQLNQYEKLMPSWRDPNALLVYAGKIKALSGNAEKDMQQAYRRFIAHLLGGTLNHLRFTTPHFAKLEPAVSQKWMALHTTKAPLKGYLPGKALTQLGPHERFRLFLQDALQRDNHVTDWESKFPLIARLLTSNENSEGLLKELSILKPSPENKIQELVLKLATRGHTTAPLLVELAVQLKAENFSQWGEDLEKFTQALFSKVENYETWSIGVTNDPCDLVLLAKETGGCQSIDGIPYYNKCALAYMMDGKNLPVYIRGSDGKLKARALLRFLHHKQTGKAALFLERHYNSLQDSLLSKALNTYASELAQKLDLPLFTKEALKEDERGQLHACTLESLGSNAPFEYSDAMAGITQGVFTIEDAYVMFMPLKVTQPLRAIHDPNGIAFARHFGL